MQVEVLFHCGDGRRLTETAGDMGSLSCLLCSHVTAMLWCLKQFEVKLIVLMLQLMIFLCDQVLVRRMVSTAGC